MNRIMRLKLWGWADFYESLPDGLPRHKRLCRFPEQQTKFYGLLGSTRAIIPLLGASQGERCELSRSGPIIAIGRSSTCRLLACVFLLALGHAYAQTQPESSPANQVQSDKPQGSPTSINQAAPDRTSTSQAPNSQTPTTQSPTNQTRTDQAATNQARTTRSEGGVIHGIVKSGNMPIPGAEVTITQAPSSPTGPSPLTSGGKISTWTDVDGSYSAAVPAYGSYTVRVEMVAFANSTHDVAIDASHQDALVNFEMTLLSRTREVTAPPRREVGQGQAQRGFQTLSAMQNLASQDAGGNGLSDVVPQGMPVPGIDPNSATESIAVSGNTSNPFNSMSGAELEQRVADARLQGGGFGGGLGGGPGEFGGGRGGFGGGGGRGFVITGRRGFDINHPHGSLYYGIGDSALNAAPYELTGQPPTKPAYLQNSFGGSVGGPLNIPKIYHGGTKTFFFVNYNGKRGENPFDQFSTVPTLAERQGNFSALCKTGFNGSGVCNDLNSSGQTIDQLYSASPVTGVRTPYANNMIPGFASETCPWSGPFSNAAAGLLQYIPCPNLPGDFQNFHYVTSTNNNSDDLNVRVNHTLGAAPAGGPRRGRGAPRNNLTFGFHYHGSGTNITNPFPSVGGSTSVRSFDVPIGYVRTIGKLTNSLRFDFNRSRTHTQNLYAFSDDVDSALGITGVSTNPFDWGLPNLSFGDLTSLQDTNPQLLRNQTYTFSDYVVWTHGKHSWRWGGDFRRVQLNTEASSNARGSFVFSGANTSQLDAQGPIPGTGYDFADFLLGLPQQTSVQFGQDNYHFHGNYWDLYLQDEWKMRGNLTLNLGVRYEYVSPLTEENNLIANLDLSPLVFTPGGQLAEPVAAVVVPGQAGPYSGNLPASLVRPDRKGFAPRVGFAWKPFSKTVVRGGYGINYNTGAYQTIAQQLAFQPPFSTAATNIQTTPGELTLQNGFPAPIPGSITNSYAVNPNYRFGYVQIRNLDIQQQIRPTLLLNVDYTGTKGTNLDILEAPNRTISASGISTRILNVQAFTFENSVGDSEANAGSVRLRKRLSNGFSIGGIYTFSKSIDDASSIGAGATVGSGSPGLGAGGTGVAGGGATASPGSGANSVAQNPFNLSAERGLSSFNQTHKFTADYLWELPFGHDKRWLTGNTPLRAIFGDWQWSGDWTIASGLPFTPRFLANAEEIEGGTNGTLRPDLVPGQSIQLSNPSIREWFNTSAFVTPPTGQYGNARRNSIIGPGSKVFDMALTKVIPLQESRMLEFRAQATNVFNIPNYSSIDTNLNSLTFGQVTAVGAMRQITMTARFRF
jgi:trimeric autotransporter adhesin